MEHITFAPRLLLLIAGVFANPDNDVPGIKGSKDEQNINQQSNPSDSDTDSDTDNDQLASSHTADDIEPKLHRLTCESDSSKSRSPIVRQSSSGEFGSSGPPVVTNVRPRTYDCSAPSTLSTDDLTIDAAMVRPPQRSAPGQIKKTIDNSDDEDKAGSKGEFGDELQNLKKAHTVTDPIPAKDQANHEEMEEFIKHLIAKGNKFKDVESIKLFDAAVIYDKNDYAEVSNFINQVKTMVMRELGEEVRIELYDGEVFSQSQIVVVEDLINKCSVVLAYLTTSCTTETFKLLCEEGIGLSRLALNNPDVLANRMRNDKEFVLKPVHTAHPTERYYRTPIGLVTVNGIDWYDRHSAHTRSKIISIMKSAIITRKRREEELNTKESYRKAIISGNVNVPHMKSTSGSKLSLHGGTHHTPSYNSTVAEDGMSARIPEYMGALPSQLRSAPGIPPLGYNPMQNPELMLRAPPSFQAQPSSQHGFTPLPVQHLPNMVPIYPGQTQYSNNGHLMSSVPANQGMSYPPIPGGVYSGGMNNHNAQFPNMSGTGYIAPMGNGPHAPNVLMQQQNQYYGNVPQPQNPSIGHPATMMNAYDQQNTSYRSQNSLPYQQKQSNAGHPQFGQRPQNSNARFTQQQLQQQFQHGPQQLQHRQQRPHEPQVQQSRPLEPHQHQVQQLRLNSPRYSSSDSLYANDAPPSSELRVVSKVTGKLIVHPNLSTDDVEVDTGGDSSEPNADQKIVQPKAMLQSGSDADSRYLTTSDTDESDDSDSEDDTDTDSDDDAIGLSLPHMINEHGKSTNKHVNIVGCKYVQLGRNNRIKEDSSVLSKPTVLQKQSPEVPKGHSVSDCVDTCGSRHTDEIKPAMDASSSAPTNTYDNQPLDNKSHSPSLGSDALSGVPTPHSHQNTMPHHTSLPSHVQDHRTGQLNTVNVLSRVSHGQSESELSSGISEDCQSPIDGISENDLFGTNEGDNTKTHGNVTELTFTSFTDTSDNRTDSQTSTFSFSQFAKSFRAVAPSINANQYEVRTSDSDVD